MNEYNFSSAGPQAVVEASRQIESNLDRSGFEDEIFERTLIAWPFEEHSGSGLFEESSVVILRSTDGELEPYDSNDIYEGQSGEVIEHGLDVLAFYKSFRFADRQPAKNKWGIFFIKNRCRALASEMKHLTGESFTVCLNSLIQFLYVHELYHYKIDAYMLQLEATGGLPTYRPYRFFQRSLPIDQWYEEAIANHYALLAVRAPLNRVPLVIQNFFEELVLQSPGAYALGANKSKLIYHRIQVVGQSTTHRRFAAIGGQRIELIRSTILAGTKLSSVRGYAGNSTAQDTTLGPMAALTVCPSYWVDFAPSSRFDQPTAITISEIEQDFIERYLAGKRDRKTDHTYYKIDNGELLKMPNTHAREVTYGEFANLIGKAGMTSAEFHAARRDTRKWRKDTPRRDVKPARPGFSKSREMDG